MPNVFEFLGLDSEHRPTGKVVQLVKNFEEVPESKIRYPLFGQVKLDGVYGMLVVSEGKAGIFGRTGKALSSCGHIVEYHRGVPDGVYIGEIILPGYSLEVLSGIVNPNRTNAVDQQLLNDWLSRGLMLFHDILDIGEFIRGFSGRSYCTRHLHLLHIGLPSVTSVEIHDAQGLEAFAQECISWGEEGAVFKRDTDWEAGHKGWRAMKRVRRVEYDLLCIGVEEGKGKYAGKVANLIFKWRDGKTIKAMLGKDWSHQDAEGMFHAFHGDLGASPGNPVGEIFRVYGLQDSSKGKIRLPKVGEHRIDKDTPDY